MADHVQLPGSRRQKKDGAVRVADLDPSEQVEVTVTLAGPALPDPSPGEPMSRDGLRRFGANPATIKQVSEALEAHGLRIDGYSELTRSLRASGTVAQMESVFRPKLGTYRTSGGRVFRGREGDLQIPAELDGLITGVFGFDQRRVAYRKAQRSAAAARLPTSPVSPSQIAAHYRFPAGTGAGQTIAIAEFGGGFFPDDLAAFCAKHDTPVPKVTTASVNGSPILTLEQIRQLPQQQQTEQLGDSKEVGLDVQIVAGLAPDAAIVLYFSTFDQKGWVDLLNELIDGKPAASMVLSVSWGLAEDDPDWSKGALSAINERLQALANLGITVCAAAGDDG